MKNPEIRFIDDNIDWKTKQLKEVSVPLKSGTLTQDKLSPDGKYPVVNGGVSYYGYYDNYNNENAFTISARGENAGFCRFNKDKFWAGGLCYPYKGKGLFDTHFISILLNKYEKEIKENYVIRTSIPAVNKSDIEHFNMKFPSISVQKEISSLLSDIDQKISNQEILIQKLKDTKSALLIKMFPQKNQSVPELRFDSFTNDWEQRKVKELCSISTGKSNTQDKINDGAYPFYVRSPIIEKSNKYLYDEEAVITIGDGVGTGKVFHYVNGKYDLHQRCYRMYNFSHKLNAKYFYHIFSYLFYDRVMSMTAKTSVDSVRLDMIADMQIPTPNIYEQQRISALFENLNSLITLHQCKLDKLKEVKSALLDKLLV